MSMIGPNYDMICWFYFVMGACVVIIIMAIATIFLPHHVDCAACACKAVAI